MENEIKIFESEEFGKIRTVIKDEEPWFVLADICKVLEISNGVYENAVLTALKGHSNLSEIVLCTDNDIGGMRCCLTS